MDNTLITTLISSLGVIAAATITAILTWRYKAKVDKEQEILKLRLTVRIQMLNSFFDFYTDFKNAIKNDNFVWIDSITKKFNQCYNNFMLYGTKEEVDIIDKFKTFIYLNQGKILTPQELVVFNNLIHDLSGIALASLKKEYRIKY
jgi:hypothetical protein